MTVFRHNSHHVECRRPDNAGYRGSGTLALSLGCRGSRMPDPAALRSARARIAHFAQHVSSPRRCCESTSYQVATSRNLRPRTRSTAAAHLTLTVHLAHSLIAVRRLPTAPPPETCSASLSGGDSRSFRRFGGCQPEDERTGTAGRRVTYESSS